MSTRTKNAITLDSGLIGAHVRVTRVVTALQPTREWTGTCVWAGQVTDRATRDAVTGDLTGVCVRTPDEHT